MGHSSPVPALVLWPLQCSPLGLLPVHRDGGVLRTMQEPVPALRRLYAGCRSGRLQGGPPDLGRTYANL
jgi:hypothetical protein